MVKEKRLGTSAQRGKGRAHRASLTQAPCHCATTIFTDLHSTTSSCHKNSCSLPRNSQISSVLDLRSRASCKFGSSSAWYYLLEPHPTPCLRTARLSSLATRILRTPPGNIMPRSICEKSQGFEEVLVLHQSLYPRQDSQVEIYL